MKREKNKRLLWVIIPALLTAFMAAGLIVEGFFEVQISGEFTMTILGVSVGYTLFLIWAMVTLDNKSLKEKSDSKGIGLVVLVLAFALIVRLYIGLMITGYPTDMACWTGWSAAASGKGLFSIYSDLAFIDYPPGYVYVLHIIGTIGKLTGIAYGTPAYNLMLKAPAIIADLVMAWIIYRLCVKRLKPTMGMVLAFLYILNPMVIMDSAAWGQIDAVLTLAVVGYLLALYKEKIVVASLFFVAGLLIKPQMLFFGPVLAVVFIKYIIDKGWGKAIKAFLISIFSGTAIFAAAVIPFTGDMPWYWIFEKYVGTIGSYNYITLNSANIYGMLGLNWVPTDSVRWGLALGVWGLIGLLSAVLVYFVLGFLNRNRGNIFMLTAMMMTGIYTLALKMHERYIFPVLVILLLAYIYENKNSIIALFGLLSAAVFINVSQVLAVIHIPPGDIVFRLSSMIVVISFIWMVIHCFISVKKSIRDSSINLIEASDESFGFKRGEESDQGNLSE